MTSATPKPRAGEHTKGPWHWDSDPVKDDPTGRVRYRVCALGKTITQVYYSSFEGGATNAEADARLIAAAPDLLAIIKLYLLTAERGTLVNGRKKLELRDIGALARATLNKITPSTDGR